jgi:CRISPR-associated protein Cas6
MESGARPQGIESRLLESVACRKDSFVPVVDLAFLVQGTTIPSDHGYALYSAICHTLETRGQKLLGPGQIGVSGAPTPNSGSVVRPDGHVGVGIHPINGQYVGSHQLQLSAKSRLRPRVPVECIPQSLALAGKLLDLDGHRLRVGVPTVHALTPAATLVARLVTIKGFKEPEPFLAAARRQLDELGFGQEAELGISRIESGPRAGEPRRRILRIKDKKVVGFPLQITGLTAEESLRLQEHDGVRAPGDGNTFVVPPLRLGGRRTMGCGLFVPVGPRMP